MDRIKELLLSENYDDRVLACNIMIRTLTKGQCSKILDEVYYQYENNEDYGEKYHIIRKKNSWGFNMVYGYPNIDNSKELEEFIKNWGNIDEIIITEL